MLETIAVTISSLDPSLVEWLTLGTVRRENKPIVQSDPVQNVPKNRNQQKIDIYSGSSSSAPASPLASGGSRKRQGGASSAEQHQVSSDKTWR